MTLIVPTSKEVPDYLQRTQMDGRDYVLRFVWNAREARWYFSIADADGVDIATGIKVVASWDLLRKVQDDRRPPGILIPVDMSDTSRPRDPAFAEFSPDERVRLMYLDEATVAALAGA